MKSTEIYQMKRNLLTFLEKLTKGLSKPRKKFYNDILYGMSKAQNTLLSDIARALEEKIDLQYTIKRLSRNATEENDLKQIHQNYLNNLKTAIPDNPLVIVDESEIVKPYAEKMEDLVLVRDASKNVPEKGYPTLNFSMATPKTKHPLQLYNHLYSSKEEDFQLEKTRTMTLSSLRILYTILNCIIGHYSLAIEKNIARLNYHYCE